MSRKLVTTVAVVAAAGGGVAGATAVLGGGAELGPRGEATLEVSVRDGNAAAAGAGARASGKTKFSYPTGGVQTIPDAAVVNVDITNCPRKARVLNGTFETDGPSLLETSHPLGKRGWRVRLFNHGEPPAEYQAIFGLVCAKAAKKK